MAFWELYKWYAPWSRTQYPDMIYIYKEYCLKTPEQRENERQQRKNQATMALFHLVQIAHAFNKFRH